ncbi:hypothetical protein T484DRAFT_1776300, partial [Baffinella frigidus]
YEKHCCGLCLVATATRKIPGVPEHNVFGCTLAHPVRRYCIRLTSNPYFDTFFLLVSTAHCGLLVTDSSDDEFFKYLVGWMSFTATLLYLIQILICSIAFGFWGHKYSYLSYDVFNRLDFIATLGCGLELIALLYLSYDVFDLLDFIATLGCGLELIALDMDYNFTIRAVRLFRVFKPMLALDTFKGVGHVIRTFEDGFYALCTVTGLRLFLFSGIEDGFYALCTVTGLLIFLFMAFAILGMNAYPGSFRRRCVW